MINHLKIGILTYHRSHNYGAFLQAYALTLCLRELGYDSELIDYNMVKAQNTYMPKRDEDYDFNVVKYAMFNEQLTKLPLSDFSIIDDDASELYKKMNEVYDVVIVGSDEVWKTDGFRGFPNPYWLPTELKTKKLGYAISSRSDVSKLNGEQLRIFEKCINDFEYIGLRDAYSIYSIKKYCENKDKIYMNCDPTFLYDFKADEKRGEEILKRYGIDSQKKILLVMTNNKILVKLLHHKFKECVMVSIFYKHENIMNIPDLTPFELLDVIKTSDLLITSFFHGMCFAIQNDTHFIADDYREKSKEQSKIYDLMQREDLLDRFVSKRDFLYLSKMVSLCKKYLNEKSPDFSGIVEKEKLMSQSFFSYLGEMGNE